MYTTKHAKPKRRPDRRRERRALLEQLEPRLLMTGGPPSTVGLYNPAASEFLLRYKNLAGNPDQRFVFSSPASSQVPLTGDFNGDRLDTAALYDRITSSFHLRNDNAGGPPEFSFVFGQAGVSYQPIVGDWNGDGVDTVGLFRGDTGEFTLRNANSAGSADVTLLAGPPGGKWIAIAGDWNGDGIDTVGLYDPARKEFHLRSANSSSESEQVFAFGGSGVQPLAGDWNGDGTDTIGVYDRVKNAFSLRNRNSAGKTDATFAFGKAQPGWSAVAGNWTSSAALPTGGVYTVPGESGRTVSTKFTWVSRSAAANNELGLFPVDDTAGKIGKLRPGDKGYAAAALGQAGRTVLFASGEGAGATKTLELAAGSKFALYLIENDTTADFLTLNPQNSTSKRPLAFFTLAKANSDQFDHVRYQLPNQFAWEDIRGGGDKDFNDLIGRIDYLFAPPAPSDTTPPAVVITSPAVNLVTSQNVSVVGRATDEDSGLAQLLASIDGSALFDVAFAADGQFQIPIALPLDGTRDGQHTFTVQATDRAGNRSSPAAGSFVLDTTIPPLDLDLAPESDTGTLGDRMTAAHTVTLVGQSEPGAVVALAPSGLLTTADAQGAFRFEQIPLVIGVNMFEARATDPVGNQTVFSLVLTREECAFDETLTDWTITQSGGTDAGRGGVEVVDCAAVISEGDSFLVSFTHGFTVPDAPSAIRIDFDQLAFDAASPGRAKDAFELALLDAAGRSLVHAVGAGRDGFFNASEGQPAAAAAGVQVSGQTILVSLAGLAPGSEANLVLRLVNNDGDTQTSVAIHNVAIVATPGAVPPEQLGSARVAAVPQEIDVALLAEVTASVTPRYAQTSFDEDTQVLHASLALQNTGSFGITGPVVLAIRNLSDPAVSVRNADGVTPAGLPFFVLSELPEGGVLSPSQTTGAINLALSNPGRTPFTYELVVLGQLNQSPQFTSDTIVEALVGRPYSYDADAFDPDGDPLSFTLVSAPAGMAIDPASGRLSFAPEAANAGTHAVRIRVLDDRGGSAAQSFVLAIESDLPNRPPVISSVPRVDASVSLAYAYDVLAADADGDSLTFVLAAAPQGMSIDAATGRIVWTPTVDQLGNNGVEVSVVDDRGGVASQVFAIAVAPEIGNHDPVITSTPITQYTTAGSSSSQAVGNVSPNVIALELVDGQTALTTVRLDLPAAGSLVPDVDVFLLFDDTGSFARTAPAVVSQFQSIIEEVQVALPNVHFGFGVGRFEDYSNVTIGNIDRPFILNQPIVTTDRAGFQDAIQRALAEMAHGGGGDGPESLIEALFQTATGLGFDGNGDGDTTDTGLAGTMATQLVFNASGDVPAFASFADPVPFSFRLLDAASAPALPLDTTITRTLNPGSLSDLFQFQGAAGLRLFFDSLAVQAFQPVGFNPDSSQLSITRPRWTLFDSSNSLVAQGALETDRELTLPDTDTFLLLVENTDIESILDYSFRLTTPETLAVPYVLGTSIASTIGEARERDEYTFSLLAPARLVVDEITGGSFNWTLEGPQGVLKQDVTFNSTRSSLRLPESSIEFLSAGDYRLTIAGSVDATGQYRFRLSDLGAATSIDMDAVVNATIDNLFETKAFRFDAQTGDHISWVATPASGVFADLIDPFGQAVFVRRGGGFAEATLPLAGAYTLLLERSSPSVAAVSFVINELPPPIAAPFALGDLITGSIDRVGETDAFSFSLATPAHVHFDSLDNLGANLQMSLTDSLGRTHLAARFSEEGKTRAKPFQFLPAGNYQVTIDGLENGTAPYSFRISDIASAPVLAYGVTSSGSLSPGTESEFFTLIGTEGDQVSFNLQAANFNGPWRLFGPTGLIFTRNSLGNDSVTVTLPLSGTYRMLLEGGFGDTPYTLHADLLGNVPVSPPPSTPLTLGSIVDGQISVAGEVDRYTLSLDTPRLLAFDVLSAGSSGITWSMKGADGVEVQSRPLILSDGQFSQNPLRLDAGSYELSLTANTPAVGYSFRLLDLATATPFGIGATVTGAISPAQETDLLQFDVTAPGRFFINNQTAQSNGVVLLKLVDPLGFVVLSTTFVGPGTTDGEADLQEVGTYTLLLEGNLNNQNAQPYQFTVAPIGQTPPSPLAFGQLVDASIAQPGETDSYTFTLAQNGRIYLDAMTENNDLRYTLSGPFGTIVSARPFTQLEIGFNPSAINPFPAVAGQYTITVDALGDTTPAYRFRVLDVAAAAPISLATTVSGTLAPGNSSQFFRIDIPQAGAYFFDHRPLPLASRSNTWRLYDPFGNVAFNGSLLGNPGETEATLNLPGTYLLLLEGALRNAEPSPFEFLIHPVVTSNPVSLTLNQTVTGSIDGPGDSDRYTFSVPVDTLVYFDSLTDDSLLTWTITGQLGPVGLGPKNSFLPPPVSRDLARSDGVSRDDSQHYEVVRLLAGDYTLTMDGTDDHTGPYQFLLSNVESALPVTLGTPISGDFSPRNETDLYRFEASAGDTLIVHSGPLPADSVTVYSLVDPHGQLVNFPPHPFESFLVGEDFAFRAPRTGTYTLLVEGFIKGTGRSAYTFNVEPVASVTLSAPVTDTLNVDSVESGQIEDLTSVRIYNFAATAGQRLLFDGIQAGGGTVFRLVAPSGQDVFSLRNRPDDRRAIAVLSPPPYRLDTLPVANRGPFTLPESGTYQLIVDATEDSVRTASPSGVGGAGFRSGALPIILAATDTGTAFQPDGIDPIVGAGGVSIPLAELLSSSRATTPQGRGATIQETISALNSLGALVLGLGTNAQANSAPRRTLEAIARLTGAVNASANTLANNTSDPIGPGDPFYYQIQGESGTSAAAGITAAILQSVQNVAFDIDVVASDPNVVIENLSGLKPGIGAGESASFDVRFTGDGEPRNFDLLFIVAGTGIVLGSIPVSINSAPYLYDVDAIDPDGDAISFSLTTAPAGASIESATGLFAFNPPGPGQYPFTVEVADGRGGIDTQEFIVAVDETGTGEIRGTMFHDLDRDGSRDLAPSVTEPGLPGWTIFLDQDGDHRRETGERFTTTDPQGNYAFTGLGPGTYVVAEEPQLGWEQTAPDEAALGVHTLAVASGQVIENANFGNIEVPVSQSNRLPRFITTPPTAATVGRLYRYDAVAFDPDSDALSFDLPVRPTGMAIDPDQGIIVWKPTADQQGEQNVILRVRDGRGGVTLQSFTVNVGAFNSAPVITSVPGGPAVANLPFVYQTIAQDAEGNALSFSLGSPIDGAAINVATGLFSWMPRPDQVGDHTITIAASDGTNQARQTFALSVVSADANRQPVISSTPRQSTGLAHPYLYVVTASDPDGDPLAFSLNQAPSGMTIDAAGLVHWQPQPHQLGDHPVRIQVSDGRQGEATQDFAVRVASTAANGSPRITSTPPAAASVGELFVYDAAAADPDGDPLFWNLDEAPAGVSIDALKGTVRWTPVTEQVGSHFLTVRVTDTLGGTAVQRFEVAVHGVNTPPVVRSSPPTVAIVERSYAYDPRAFDLDADRLSFRLAASPEGMAIDPDSGSIRWIPRADQEGSHTVVLIADDGRGGTASQSYSIAVALDRNLPPSIASTPPTAGAVGFEFQYQVLASDPEAGPLAFSLEQAPAGMFIGADGLLVWQPQPGQQGTAAVTVLATDDAGAAARQSFAIDVAASNQSPVLNGPPLQLAAAGQLYRFDVPASDPNGDLLSYRLDDWPAGMTLDQTGRVLWQTTQADVGQHSVQITIADDRGAEIELAYGITVAIDNYAPLVQVAVDRTPVNIGETVNIAARAVDDVNVESLIVTVDGVAVSLDRNGRGTFFAAQTGLLNVAATAVDGAGNVATANRTLQVRDPSDLNAPIVAISSPATDAVVTTFTDIIGTVADDNLVSYTLAVAPTDGGPFAEIARGTTPAINSVLGRFDPTLLPNDAYRLRLTAVDAGGNVSIVEQDISVRGQLKLGEFTLSFVDVNVPVLGVPIQVARTYSSFEANRNGEVGFGWRLAVSDVALRTNVQKTGDEESGNFNPFFQGARVYVTLPGGRREGFRFEPRFRFGFGDLSLFRPEFKPDSGVTSTLTVQPFDLIASSTGEFFGMAVGGLPYHPGDSAFGGKYLLTTKEGLQYEIDGNTGDLRQVKTPEGDTLTYSDSGIVSSRGLSVTFGRDAQGRVTSVTDPEGGIVRYAYDARGDLASVTDRTGNATRFEYHTARPHFLEKLIDPLGRTGIRAEYDADGRLLRMIDADGQETQFVNDTAQARQTIIDARGNSTIHEYDSHGNILTTIDPLGGITRRTYDTNDYELTTTDPLGHTTTRSFDVRGNALSETDSLGNTSRTTYNGFSNVLTNTDALGRTTTTTYKKSGDISSLTFPDGSFLSGVTDPERTFVNVTDPLGTTHFDVDRAGNVVRELDALGNETRYTYNGNGNVLSQTSFRTLDGVRRALTTTYTYDRENRLISVRDPLGNISRTEYDPLGNQTARIDSLGRRTTYEYDSSDRLVRTNYPDGTSESIAYDAAGNKIRQVDQAGRVTLFEYDQLNRLTATIYPDETPADASDNPRRQSVYDLAGRAITSIDESGHRTDYEYDDDGQRIRTIQPQVVDGLSGLSARPLVQQEYDSIGNLTATVDANGHRTEYEFDAMARPTLTRFADGSEIRHQYDAGGRLIEEIDPAGQATLYGYDAIGRLIRVTLPAPAAGQDPLVTNYAYDEVGNRLSQTDALGHTTTLAYDELSRLIRRQRPGGESESFNYDAVGNQIRHTDFNGATTQFTYDMLDRQVRKDYPDSTSVVTTYTSTGQFLTQTDSRGQALYRYDERDRMLSRTDPDGRTIAYTYGDAGNRLSVSSPAGATNYSYDALNRLAIVTDSRDGLTEYAYDLAGNLVRTELPNATVETRAYDALNRTTSVLHTGPAGLIASFQYSFDAVGRRTSVVEDDGRRVDYDYDLTGRLVGETIAKPGSSTRTIAYAYDAVGNRLTRTDSASSQTVYEYDIDDHLLRETTGGEVTTYTYDANGNTQSIVSPTEQRALTWDAQNRLAGLTVTDAAGTRQIEYGYSSAGLRVRQSMGGQETRYLIDESLGFGKVLEEYESDGDTLAAYTYGVDLIAQERAGQTSFFHADGQGSTRVLTDVNAAATDRYFYEAYGDIMEKSGDTPNPHLFRGEQFDIDAAAYYLRAREYDPLTGRFLSADLFPGLIVSPTSLHRYSYVGGDPVNYVDPSGMMTLNEQMVVTAGIGFLAGLAIHANTDFGLIQSVAIGVGSAFLFRFAFTALLIPAAIVAPALPQLPRASDTASRVITTLQQRGGGTISNEATKGLQATNRAMTDGSINRAREIIAKEGAKFPTTARTVEFYKQVLQAVRQNGAAATDEITDFVIKHQAIVDGLQKTIDSSDLI